MVKKILGVAVAAVLAGFLSVSTARADNTHFICASCTDGSTSLISGGTSVSFSFVDVANQTVTGDGFVGILVPTGGAAPTFTGGTFEESKSFTSGDIAGLLGEGTNNFNFSQLSSASAQVIPSPSGFTVYEYDLGSVTLGPSGAGVSLSADAAAGSVIIGWLETDDGTLETPLSASITTGTPGTPGPPGVPEPASSSLLLLGIGLLAVPLGLRKRRGSVA